MLNNYIITLSKEAVRVQKNDLLNRAKPKYVYPLTQLTYIIFAAALVCIFPKGFSNEFAGYFISFLGIFVGLFTSIVITLHDKSKTLFADLDEISRLQRARLIKLKGYHIRFIGLTGFAIILGMILIILLGVVLLMDNSRSDIFMSHFVHSFKEISFNSAKLFLINSFFVIHRFFVFYLTIQFLKITIYSISSYFTYLLADYGKMKISKFELTEVE